MNRKIALGIISCIGITIFAQTPADSLSGQLNEVVVTTQNRGLSKSIATNTSLISARELTRAACCNLGESFTTNPSVDVTYSDAATGARQIKLLGLSGTYVQMLTESVPAARGASAPYYLGYIPGPWLQSIQVSKGASSVKNGYESITGQINIEMMKPQLDPSLSLNAYVDHLGKAEINALGNTRLGDCWSTGLLAHAEKAFATHDANNDGFVDMPRLTQGSLMSRWAYLGNGYVFQAAVKGLAEKRRSGQLGHALSHASVADPYIIDIDTRRLEAFTKNAYIFDRVNEGNVALILSGNLHRMEASYGEKLYYITQRELYAQLMFERKWQGGVHALSTGLSFNHDDYNRRYRLEPQVDINPVHSRQGENVTGAYAQYTFNLDNGKLVAMAGLRYDYNSLYGSLVTPRLHMRWNPSANVSLHASVGRGRRSPHPLEEYNYLMVSSRIIYLPRELKMERADNMGAGVDWNFDLGERSFKLAAEYYYTTFHNQLVADLDRSPHAVYIFSNAGRSFSQAMQFEATVDIIADMSLTAAYRFSDVRVDYGRGLVDKQLTSRSKGLFSLDYRPMMGLWQFDMTCSIIGGGSMPTHYLLPDGTPSWADRYNAYATLNAQVTRNFRSWSVYLGGENLTGYRQPRPIIDSTNPRGPDFDASMIYGPLHGAVVYIGFRYNITRYL